MATLASNVNNASPNLPTKGIVPHIERPHHSLRIKPTECVDSANLGAREAELRQKFGAHGGSLSKTILPK